MSLGREFSGQLSALCLSLNLLSTGCSFVPVGKGVADGGKTPPLELSQKALRNFADHKKLSDAEWKKLWWMSKAARLLRGGQGLTEEDNLDTLVALDREAFIEQFMRDPRFSEGLLDFSLYFLGMKPEFIRDSQGEFNPAALENSAAILASLEATRGGDFFKIFEFRLPTYTTPARELIPIEGEMGLSPTDIRARRAQLYIDYLQSEIQKLDSAPNPDTQAFCNSLFMNQAFGNFTSLFSPSLSGILIFGAPSISGILKQCFSATPANPQKLKEAILIWKDFIPTVLKLTENLSYENYKFQHLSDIRSFDIQSIPGLKPSTFFEFSPFPFRLPNSSTNANRKRGAWVLDRFFCDDLTPVNVEDSGNHAVGRHASEISCQACHFKLDPMAGFFKDYGIGFSDFSNAPNIVFDDRATMNRTSYQEQWKAPPDSGREWNIGYIRSASRPSLNKYGTQLEDLFVIAKSSDGVKRCLAKRSFEYFVSPDQALDGSYLDDLAAEFQKVPPENSGTALKNIIRRLLLSESFSQEDPIADRCYDFGSSHDPNTSLPCAVSSILKKNCISCHDGSSGDLGEATLDLSRWQANANGESTFPHLDLNGKPLTKAQSLEKILERLSSRNPDERMPLNKFMSDTDRQKFYLWVQEELKGR